VARVLMALLIVHGRNDNVIRVCVCVYVYPRRGIVSKSRGETLYVYAIHWLKYFFVLSGESVHDEGRRQESDVLSECAHRVITDLNVKTR